jgi:hypothetical protein
MKHLSEQLTEHTDVSWESNGTGALLEAHHPEGMSTSVMAIWAVHYNDEGYRVERVSFDDNDREVALSRVWDHLGEDVPDTLDRLEDRIGIQVVDEV